MTKYITAAFVVLFAATAAHAGAPRLAGVWQGTLGEQSVVACFDSIEGSSPAITGWYYYNKYRVPIALREQEDSNAAQLRERNGGWQLQTVEADRIVGRWNSNDGKRQVNLRLQRVDLADITAPESESDADSAVPDGPACGSYAFKRGLERGQAFQRSKVHELSGLRYRTLSFELDETGSEELMQLNGVELLGDSSALQAISQYLQQLTPQPKDLFDCRREDQNGEMMYFVRLREVRAHWLVVTVQGHAWCPKQWGVTEDVLLFDLRTGARYSPLDWFEADAPESPDTSWRSDALPTSLADLLASRLDVADQGSHFDRAGIEQCYGSFATVGWRLVPTDNGVEFILPVTNNGSCGERIELSASDLFPLLNSRGRAAFADLGLDTR